jgi:hypothetical protein
LFGLEEVRTGHRLNFETHRQAIQSLFRWHNETFNSWSHLLGTIVCLIAITVIITGKNQAEGLIEKAYLGSDQRNELSIGNFIEANLASISDEPDAKNESFVEELAYLVVQECQRSVVGETSFDCLS